MQKNFFERPFSKKLLIVEDKKKDRNELTELLKHHNYLVLRATSGRNGVTKALKRKDEVGVILMDIKMPGEIDGIEAIREIQQEYPQIPTIMVTGHAEELEYQKRVREANLEIVDWVDKPIVGPNRKKLLEIVANEMMKKEIRSQIESQLWKAVPLKMIQDFLKKLIIKHGMTLLVEVIREMERRGMSNPLNSNDLFPHLNFLAYQNMREELERDYPGQFVAFLEGKMVEHKADRDDLIRAVYQEHKRTDIFITQITKEKEVIKLRRPRRIIR